ncbi:MAG: 2-succinyl-5-enolpyruvyl-6-hydroxy-3-cyclohexene-1-carboxylic-acid synthase [Verrucomicrobia bacterium]|nr:2-succinyl-5-enolpyruvyl-6-hydroxy-3-cyclohexene-1-carboxylic-acid synthase [Cytophagales bacterium]
MHETIRDIIEICYQRGIENFVICPGSRSAPLTLALARHPHLKTLVIGDERAAAFTALGMALQSKKTVGLVCTSGTAVLNFAPAVAEAFFQEIPLLILTADRPNEWIAQQDGQTLYQNQVYGKNVKTSLEIPADFVHEDTVWFAQRVVNEAITLTQTSPKAPVHINIPLREPLYPKPDEKFVYNNNVKIINTLASKPTLEKTAWDEVFEIWEDADKCLIVAGQQDFDGSLAKNLQKIQEEWEIPVIGDIISNLHHLPEIIKHQDLLLMQTDENLLQQLQPDLLITFGKSLISKHLKTFLRKYKPRYHWHIQPAGVPADTFQTLTHHIPMNPTDFFESLFADLDFIRYQSGDDSEGNPAYFSLWQQEQLKVKKKFVQTIGSQPFGEFAAVQMVLEKLPENSLLHLANSMAVRYANFISLECTAENGVTEVFANRGTSGIDGCTSTAVGAARMTKKLVTLITGDMAFFYDRNALWQPQLPDNLRIIILNNHGGGIFRIIDAGNQPEIDDFFETQNPLTAENTARDFGLEYQSVTNAEELNQALETLFEPSEKPKILEIETDSKTNTAIYKAIKTAMNP